MVYGGFLTLANSHLHHYWQYPTMVGFCHGGNMLGNHDDDDDDGDDGVDTDVTFRWPLLLRGVLESLPMIDSAPSTRSWFCLLLTPCHLALNIINQSLCSVVESTSMFITLNVYNSMFMTLKGYEWMFENKTSLSILMTACRLTPCALTLALEGNVWVGKRKFLHF